MLLDIISSLNSSAFGVASSLANPSLTALMVLLSESFIVVIPLLALWLYHRKDKNVFSFVSAFVLFYAVAELLKVLIAQSRPCIGLPGCEPGFGFPSSHATALAGPYLFLTEYKYLRFLYPVWLFLVLFGRIYLGQHTLIQVLAGVVISLVLGYVIYYYRKRVNNAFISHLHIKM